MSSIYQLAFIMDIDWAICEVGTMS